MHDEVSEKIFVLKLNNTIHFVKVSATENLRKNLAVERLIVEGCDILLDVKQIFVRQGTLIQIPNEKQKEKVAFKGFKISSKSDKELVRQCFLFSYHLIITTR